MPETFFHPKVGEMIIDETPTWECIRNLTIIGWTTIEEEQLAKVNKCIKENVQQMKVNVSFEPAIIKQLIDVTTLTLSS